MKVHGEPLPLVPEDIAGGMIDSGDAALYRNIFAPLDRPLDPKDAYQGIHVAGSMDKRLTRAMLARLAKRMEEPFGWQDPLEPGFGLNDNPYLPSGYTYLAQLVAHDLSHVTTILPAGAMGSGNINIRRSRLVLETIYGGGPSESPSTYVRGEGRDRMRTRFRLGNIRYEDAEPGIHEARDIPRATCPFVADIAASGLTEVVIGDQRNDNSIMLSQLTALFHLLHNGVFARLPVQLDGSSPAAMFRADSKRFARAQHFVVGLYRRLLVSDFLSLLLNREVYAAYNSARGMLVDREGAASGRIPLEFSHAVYRMGHAMVRQSYRLNSAADRPLSVVDTVAWTSAMRARDLPLLDHWIVQWQHFFDMKPEMPKLEPEMPNLSRRLQPSFTASLLRSMLVGAFDETPDAHGLVYRDLVRGASRPVRSVASTVEKLMAHDLTAPAIGRHPLLTDPAFRAASIAEWLVSVPSVLTPEDIDSISRDPPLEFFVLFEAAMLEDGARLGPLGSAIVAEVMFGELFGEDGSDPVDRTANGETFDDIAVHICPEPEGVPVSLAGLVKLTETLDPSLKIGQTKFI